MGDVVNLRRARKRKERQREEAVAAERRIVFGQTKAERRLIESERAKAKRDLESHGIARPDRE
jgi:hypothetical protein